jgi:hypothetical protein
MNAIAIKPTIIKLTMEEMMMVTVVAGMRRSESKLNNRKDSHGFNGDGAWDIEIEGCAAEMAYCKLRNQYWSGSVCSFKGADCGDNVQIRHTVRDNGSLIIREGDNDDHYYVLVTGRAPNLKVIGWIKGANAKKEEYKKSPNGREPAFFIHQSNLSRFK